MPGQQRLRCDDGGHLRQKLPSEPLDLATNRRRWSSFNRSRRH
jgi:hypothetical protein